MFRYLKLILLTAALSFSFVACEKDPPKSPINLLSVNPSTLMVPNLADSALFLIIANDRWEVISDEEWFDISPLSGFGDSEIRVAYTNIPGIARSGNFVVKAAGHVPDSVNVPFSQSAQPGFKVSPVFLSLSSKPDSQLFIIRASGDWSVTDDMDWLSLSQSSGTGNGSFMLYNLNNAGSLSRSGKIIVNAPDHFPLSVEIVIQQAQFLPELNVIPNAKEVEYDSEATAFTVESEGDWTATADVNERWLTISPDRNFFRVLYGVNLGPARSVDITVVAEGHSPSQITVVLTQAAEPGTPPETPSSLRYTDIYWDQIDLKWTDESVTETGFRVDRRSRVSNWETIAVLDAGVVSYSDANLNSRESYTYHVFAFNQAGDSEPTSGLTIITHSPVVGARFDNLPSDGNIEFNGDADWFSYVVSTASNYVFTINLVDPGLGDSKIWLYGPNTRTRLLDSDDNSGIGNASMITQGLNTGVHYIRAESANVGDSGNYTITARAE